MARDFQHGFLEQLFSWRNFVPGRRAGGMREWNEVETMLIQTQRKSLSNDIGQFFKRNKLGDREFANGDNKTRS